MRKLFYKVMSISVAAVIAISLLPALAFADTPPTINGKTDLGVSNVTYSSNVQKPYTMTIVVAGSPQPTVEVTGTAKAYYKDGKIIVPLGLKASTTPYTVDVVAKNSSGKATMGLRITVVEMPAVNGYWKKSVTLNLKEGYASPYVIPCVVTGLPAPTPKVTTNLQGVFLDGGKLYIPGELTPEDSPYEVKVSATNNILGQDYTAETTYTINVYSDGHGETGEFEKPSIEGPDFIELAEGYGTRPSYKYEITGKPYPIVTATGVDGVDVIEGTMVLPLGLNAKTRDYLVTLTASNDYGSDVQRIAIRVIKEEEDNGGGEHTGGEGDPNPTPGPSASPDPDPEPTATPAPTKKPSGGGGGSSSSSQTIDVNGYDILVKTKDDRLTMMPKKADIQGMLGDMEDSEYVFDLSSQDYAEVIWQIDPRWFDGIPDDTTLVFKQIAGNVTITGSMMKKLIDKAPKGVVNFVFREHLVFVIEKGSTRAKWNDPDEPIYIEIPYEGSANDNLTIKSSQSGTDMPDATDVEYKDGFVCGTVFNTGKYTVE